MCSFFQVSRSAYYAWRANDLGAAPDPRQHLVWQAWQASGRTYGYRRIPVAIQRQSGQIINPKAVLRLMQVMHIRSVARQPNPYRAMQVGSYFYADLLHRDFSAQAPNEKWVGDFTYLRIRSGFVYLGALKDLFDGFIVGYHLARQKSVSLAVVPLGNAVAKLSDPVELKIHTDQGHPYNSFAYWKALQRHGLQASMSRKANPWDNAPMESFFSHLKQEVIQNQIFSSFEEVQQVVDDYIYFYNYERIQLETKLTPFEVRRQFV